MTINFSELLSTEQKRNLIENRIAQFAAEGYQHTLNLGAAEKLEDEQLIEAGVPQDLIRISVGLEDVEDILWDLDQALTVATGSVRS